MLFPVWLCFVGVCFTPQVARLLGANNFYLKDVCDYLFWYAIFLIPAQIGFMLHGFCRNDGSPKLVTGAVISSTVVNIFLDWLFIFPYRQA
jgi:Na+-driven multidrug efflux pump